MKHLLLILALFSLMPAISSAVEVRGFSLTQNGTFNYDATTGDGPKTNAQTAVDDMYKVGTRHVVLTPIARMSSGTSTTIVMETPPGLERNKERQRYLNLIKYIHSKGMTVGIRPILLVVRDPAQPQIWHGNIKPSNPMAWFDSLRTYLGHYVMIAKMGAVEEFTVGAELYSMTVGLEDQWPEYPYGFPREWLIVIKDIKEKLGTKCRVMYDINYTDQTRNDDGTGASGGELERWRYRLVDLKPLDSDTSPTAEAWRKLKELWLSFDAVGLDIYRSLLARDGTPLNEYSALVSQLQERADLYASDIDGKVFEIENAIGQFKKYIIKEIGFKSCEKGFIDPFQYDDPRSVVNVAHQAAAYQAVSNAFVKPQWPWLQGIVYWDYGVEPARGGMADPGFTPRGKPQTEEVILNGWE